MSAPTLLAALVLISVSLPSATRTLSDVTNANAIDWNHHVSDDEFGVQVQRRLGDGVLDTTDNGRNVLTTIIRQGTRNTAVRGRKSTFAVTYSGDPPLNVRVAFGHAVAKWADVFPCLVQLRIQFKWQELKSVRTLMAAISPFSIAGLRLPDGVAYTPVMAAALLDRDLVPDMFHIQIVANAAQPWHLDPSTNAPHNQYDFVTAAMRELCHSLFFTGALIGNRRTKSASFQSINAYPSRFDDFLHTRNGVAIARSCNAEQRYRAITTSGLKFQTTVDGSAFSLHAPAQYQLGSSTYTFDSGFLAADCRKYNITKENCSDLMTPELDPGYTQHNIGEPTLRVMRTVLGSVEAPSRIKKCVIPEPVEPIENRVPGTFTSDGTGKLSNETGGNNSSRPANSSGAISVPLPTQNPEQSTEIPEPTSNNPLNEGCIAVIHLQGAKLLYRNNLHRTVLCEGSICATPNHALIVDGEWTSMQKICDSGRWSCVRTTKYVNNLRISHNRRITIAPGVIATPYDVRYPRIASVLAQFVVNVGYLFQDISALVILRSTAVFR